MGSKKIDLLTSDSVFSHRRVDRGTLLLIDRMEVEKGSLVLDLGCGYGALAVCASMRGALAAAVDINPRAVWLARENLRRHARWPWLAAWGDMYGPFAPGAFHSILCNPPIRAGRRTVGEIIARGPKYLRNGGSLQLVARTRMGAKTLSSLMRDSFGNVEEAGKGSGYRVLVGRRRGGRVD
jgi:16S rRNA (guanine1207-N2)-methyltransferase